MEQSRKVLEKQAVEQFDVHSKEKEYIGLVTGQMRCKKARDMVAKELSDHIEDQTETYLEFGLSYEDAVARAVEQMGDPVEVGTAMDRIHRPRVDSRTIGFIGLLTVFGTLVQILMMQSMIDGAGGAENIIGFNSSIFSICMNSLLGFAVMLGVMFVDYSFLGKHPVAVWVGLLILLIVYQVGGFGFRGLNLATTNLSALSALMILLFAAIVYAYRNKGYKGILLCLFWLAAGFVMLSRQSGISLAAAVTLFVTGVMTVSFAVHKGWFAVKRGNAQLLLWGVWLVPLVCMVGALALGLIGEVYQTARIRHFFDPYKDPQGNGFVVLTMRERLADMKLIGASTGAEEYYWWYSLNYVMEKYGVLMGILLLAVLALLFGKMLSGLVKQQNRLGGLLGVSAVSYLVFSTVLHVMASLTLIPSTSAYLPFFTEGTNATIGCYLLLGVYLSVHRNTMILSEKRSEPKRRFRVLVEHVGEE